MPLSPIERARGFTMLEILVALLVFSLLTLTSNAILALVHKNMQHQAVFTQKFTQRQYALNLLMNDLYHVMISADYPFSSEQDTGNCTQQITFYTRNLPNVNSQYSDPLYQVVWQFNADGISRKTAFHEKKEKLMTVAKCFDLRVFSGGSWGRKTVIDTLPQAIAFNLQLSDRDNIERFIPFFQGNNALVGQ